MLSYQTVEPHALELLRQLMEVPQLRQARLVGGTALTLQYGHRSSIDLDFFGNVEAITEEFDKILGHIGTVTPFGQSKMIKAFSVDGVKIDIVNYAYPWLEDAESYAIPKMFADLNWEELKRYIISAVREYAQ